MHYKRSKPLFDPVEGAALEANAPDLRLASPLFEGFIALLRERGIGCIVHNLGRLDAGTTNMHTG